MIITIYFQFVSVNKIVLIHIANHTKQHGPNLLVSGFFSLQIQIEARQIKILGESEHSFCYSKNIWTIIDIMCMSYIYNISMQDNHILNI